VGAKYPFDEFTLVYLVPTIANLAAPTLTELGAGEDITCLLTKDGLNPGATSNGIDAAGLCSRVDSQVPGSVGYSFTLRGFRYDTDDDLWDAVSWGAATHVVVRRGLHVSTAFAASQKVEVYKGSFGEKVPAPSAANALQTFEVPLFIDAVELDASVVAAP